MDFGGTPGLISLPGTSVHSLAAATSAAPATLTPQNGGKPQCGSGEDAGEYDLPLHVAALCKWYPKGAVMLGIMDLNY